jgi:hypothetical protein
MSGRTGGGTATQRTPSANPQTTEPPADDQDQGAKADSNMAKSDHNKAPDLFVIAYDHGGASHVELLSEGQAEARVSALTWGSKQHRKDREENDLDAIEGGGTHEINRDDMHVYRLNATEVTDF